jgi:hypothetical protein
MRECECEVAFNRDGSAYLECGRYTDTDNEVPDSELDWMQLEYADRLELEAFERAIMRAEAFYEGDR